MNMLNRICTSNKIACKSGLLGRAVASDNYTFCASVKKHVKFLLKRSCLKGKELYVMHNLARN